MLRPRVFNNVSRGNVKPAGSDEGEHHIDWFHNLHLFAYLANFPLHSPIVINGDGILSVDRNGERGTLSCAESFSGTQSQKELHFFGIDDRTGVQKPRCYGTLIASSLFGVSARDLHVYMVGGKKPLWVETYEVHSINAEEIDENGCIRHDDCGFHSSSPVNRRGRLRPTRSTAGPTLRAYRLIRGA